jgi:hypothetical protein
MTLFADLLLTLIYEIRDDGGPYQVADLNRQCEELYAFAKPSSIDMRTIGSNGSNNKLLGGIVPLSCSMLVAYRRFCNPEGAFRVVGERIKELYTDTVDANANAKPSSSSLLPVLTGRECRLLSSIATESDRQVELNHSLFLNDCINE